MRKALVFFLLLVCLTSAKERTATPKEDLYFLKSAIDRTIQQTAPHVNLGVYIVSMKNGQKLYERNAKNLFVPASALKIFTGASALSILGKDFRFDTEVFQDPSGNLYLKGSGDPSLTTADLEDLAKQIAASGIQEFNGNLYIDNFDFDDEPLGPGWMWDEGAEYWNSPIDGLLVNHCCVDVHLKPGTLGGPGTTSMTPALEGVSIENRSQTTAEKDEPKISRRWKTKENIIDVEGNIQAESPTFTYRISLESPSFYAATLFLDLLAKQGIQVSGEICYAKTPEGISRLGVHSSAPLCELLLPIEKSSDNLYANCFFKKMGQVVYGAPGTWQKGADAVRKFLSEQAELDVSNLVIKDGDGLSRYDLVSPYQFVTFLRWMKEKFPHFQDFYASLPVSGIDGSLQQRMPDSKEKIFAKPGSMTGVSSFVGYAKTQDEELLAFAIMINGFVEPAIDYKKNLEDAICTLLANFSRSN
jgi:D-alanyl-D-alanine carboxypeptidase/D-alanyl-D-alanine-endopeptidase (penicillin-binding protein 4)